ncbi:MAG: hypothetical protein K0R57_1608 [Paenibacillaceae bacterium]|nr:hypothetical protein [Paenibacillaceae bacterium]
MYHILIVDDEASVVESLAEATPWHLIGEVKAYKAYSACEALEWLGKQHIDIVITDIRMPGMSGLELSQQIQSNWKSTKCLLLSGYAEFTYAKQAIMSGSIDYLLKPVSDEDLIAALQRVIGRLEEEWREFSSYQRTLYTLKENLPLLKGRLLNDLLQERPFSRSTFHEKMKILDIPFAFDEQVALLLIRLEEQFANYNLHHFTLIEFAICNIAEELSNGYFDLWHCTDDHDYLIIMVRVNSDSTRQSVYLERMAEQLQTHVKLYLKGTISIIVSNWGAFPDQISFLYQSLLSSMRRKIGSSKEFFLTMSDEPAAPQVFALQSLYTPPLLIHLLEAGRWDSVAEKLELVFRELEEQWPDSHEHILEVFYTLSASLSHLAHKNGKNFFEIIDKHYKKVLEGNPFRTVQQLREWSNAVLELIKNEMNQESLDNRISVVKQVQEFVEQQISNDVSLQAIANHIHLHPVYLSKVYKLETGENLSDYLFKFRMEKAAYMLTHSQDKIYEIAKRLGYQNTSYFIKVFRMHYGIPPQEYRGS